MSNVMEHRCYCAPLHTTSSPCSYPIMHAFALLCDHALGRCSVLEQQKRPLAPPAPDVARRGLAQLLPRPLLAW